jgi:hypothetical protein
MTRGLCRKVHDNPHESVLIVQLHALPLLGRVGRKLERGSCHRAAIAAKLCTHTRAGIFKVHRSHEIAVAYGGVGGNASHYGGDGGAGVTIVGYGGGGSGSLGGSNGGALGTVACQYCGRFGAYLSSCQGCGAQVRPRAPR